MRTNRLEALQLFFKLGSVWISGQGCILDRPATPFPFDAFRRMNTPGSEDAPRVWQSVVRDFVAFVQILPEDGPTIVTSKLDEERVISAAQQAALALGRTLSVD
jgi:hypothetical protein